MNAATLQASILSLIYLFSTSHPAYAKNACDATLQHPCIVQDTDNNSTDIPNYRDAQMIHAAYKGNKQGLLKLWISASGTPSVANLKAIMKNIDASAKGKAKRILDIDLREESHGFLNDEAITLTIVHNWINMGKTHEQSLADEQMWLNSLKQTKTIDHILTPKEFKKEKYDEGQDVSIRSLTSEQEQAEKLGFDYVRLTVTDHLAPGNIEVDRFVSLIRKLPDNTWVHVHCRGGEGRATTFMAMYDMLHNADKVSFDDIIKRQASVEPNYDLYNTSHKNPDLAHYYEERLKFLKHFYQYASDYRRGYEGSWTTWLNENHVE